LQRRPSLVGRDKLRLNDLDSTLKKYGDDGWELVSVNLDADLKGSRDGHLLVFKRPKDATAEVGVVEKDEPDPVPDETMHQRASREALEAYEKPEPPDPSSYMGGES
jgi:Domain of unknown function (DUF4177)